jgi:transcriptional regulator with XRE-family HTH domain
MNSSSPDQTRGELLRSLREAQNMDVTELARLVNLSPAQVRELESGQAANAERSLFYTTAIKDKAAVKLAHALGADPQTLWGPTDNTAVQEPPLLPDLQILDDLAVLLKKQAQAQEMGANTRRFSWVWLFGGFAALWLAGAVGFYGQQISQWVHSLRAEQPVVVAPTMPPLADAQVMVTPAVAAPAEAASQAPAAQVASPQVPSLPDVVTAAAAEASPPTSLCESQSPLTTLRASQPSKAGNSVHIVATGDLVVCVRDGQGKQTTLNLKSQESRTLLGKAPWNLRVDKPMPANFHMFFQGQKLYWPPGETLGVSLKEVAGDF